MGGVKKFLDWLEKICIVGSIFTFAVMIIMGALQVVGRYVAFGNYLFFTEEVARYMFIWGVFLASPVCLRRQSHAAVGLFVSWMPAKVRNVVLAIASLCCIFFSFSFLQGHRINQCYLEAGFPALEIPMGSIYMAIPVGDFLCFFILLRI